MNEIKFTGRGGQGVVLSSQMLGLAFFNAGFFPQCFSVFGGERRGAAVVSFLRVDREKILLKYGIRKPDELVCLDPGLIDDREIRSSLKPGGRICINTDQPPEAYVPLLSFTLALIDARKISEALGLGKVVSTAILGAYCRLSGDLPLDCLLSAIEATIPAQREENLEAARRAYDAVRIYDPKALGTAPLLSEPAAEAEIGGRICGTLPQCIDPESIVPVSRGTTEVFRTGGWESRRPYFSEKLSPCRAACPAGNDIPGALHSAAGGDFDAALGLFLQENPLPGVCGRVCRHLCQAECNRENRDGAVQIRSLERSAADFGAAFPQALSDAGKDQPMAVIGSGPAGISAAYHLARMGHPVTLIEAEKELGGVLRTAIPLYRLPEAALEKDLHRIVPLFHEIRTGMTVTGLLLKDLLARFKAVFLAPGAGESRVLEIPGSRSLGVLRAVEFLKEVRRRRPPEINGKCIVIGGGDVALDAAVTAGRLGAQTVEVVCLEREVDLPGSESMLEEAKRAGVRFHFGRGVLQFLENGGRVAGVAVSRCTSYRVENGRIEAALDQSEFIVHPADHVLVAIGEAVRLGALADGFSGIPDKGPVPVDETFATAVPGLYAGGDAVAGPGSVAKAVGAGKRAALQIHLSLNSSAYDRTFSEVLLAEGPGLSIQAFFEPRTDWKPHQAIRFQDLNLFRLEPCPPVPLPHCSTPELYGEEIQPFDREAARLAADRCLFCGTCIQCRRCLLFCPDMALIPRPDGVGFMTHDEYCKGCGTCAAVCPGGVIELRGK